MSTSAGSSVSSDDQLNSALNLMRRMPPSSIENSLAGLIELVPSLTDDLLNHIDQPLKIKRDPVKNADYILCDYNRDGDSYRSPWSNKYFPPLDDGFLPDQRLRTMEVEANKVFDIYRKQYFEGGYSSVYLFDTSGQSADNSFGACFLIHKDITAEKEKGLDKGWWDSIHVFEVNADKGKAFTYKLTSTVMVSLSLSSTSTSDSQGLTKLGEVDLSGSMTKQDERRLTIDDRTSNNPDATHLSNLGTMLEDMELRIRNAIEGIYIQKTRDVVNGMRSTSGAREKAWQQLTSSLNQAVQKRHE